MAEAWATAPAGQIYPEVQHCGAVEDGYTDGLTMESVSFADIDEAFPLPKTRLAPIEEVSHLTSSPISAADRTQLATELRLAQGVVPTTEVSDHVLLRLRMLREAEALKGKDQEVSISKFRAELTQAYFEADKANFPLKNYHPEDGKAFRHDDSDHMMKCTGTTGERSHKHSPTTTNNQYI